MESNPVHFGASLKIFLVADVLEVHGHLWRVHRRVHSSLAQTSNTVVVYCCHSVLILMWWLLLLAVATVVCRDYDESLLYFPPG
jgi:hypothetical protein